MGASNSTEKMENQMFQLRFTSRQLTKMSQRAEKEIAAEKLKLKQARGRAAVPEWWW